MVQIKDSDNYFNDIKDVLRKNIYVRNSISFNDNKTDLKAKRGLQHFFAIKFALQEKQKIYEIILGHAARAEKASPGAGMLLLSMFCGEHKENANSEFELKNKNDVILSLKRLGLTSRNFQILQTALQYSTINSKLSIKKSTNQTSYIEITEGNIFEAKSQIPVTKQEHSNIKIICIDGYIESVSEIHNVLEYLSQTKDSCIIFSRGMSEDVLHTIKINNDRGSLSLFPYIVPFDIDNVNTLVDLSVVAGSDIISSLKGNLISSIDVFSIKSVDKCSLFKDKVVIKNESSRQRIIQHIEHLKRTIEERQNLSEVISNRIKSLSSSCIEISLADDINFYSCSQQIDEGIRVISAIMNKNYNNYSISKDQLFVLEKTLDDLRGIIN